MIDEFSMLKDINLELIDKTCREMADNRED